MNNTIPNDETLVVCKNGEYFTAGESTNEGVEFDGGTIPWDEVACFNVWCKAIGRRVTIPVGE